ncbi:MAG TPA: hypothetical protein VGN63_05890 [Flavisolibacter sp.]|jgi:hypothetical protein|nr:hypothetical protein [Flavisolibacter sp.]
MIYFRFFVDPYREGAVFFDQLQQDYGTEPKFMYTYFAAKSNVITATSIPAGRDFKGWPVQESLVPS